MDGYGGGVGCGGSTVPGRDASVSKYGDAE